MRRLPRSIEREIAKFLGTIGFKDYSALLWDLPSDALPAEVAAPLTNALRRQILDQARHEPAIVAFGEAALPNVRQDVRKLVNSRGFSAPALLEGIEGTAQSVVIVPRLDPATIEKLAAVLAQLRREGATSVHIIVTDEGRAGRPPDALFEATDVQLLFWPDRYAGPAQAASRHLAMFIHILGAPTVISLRSSLGLEAIGVYGGALKSFHRLYVAFDVPAGRAGNHFIDIYHLRRTAPHATVLAFSETEATTLQAHMAGLDGVGVAVLSTRQAIFGERFEDRRSVASRTAIAHLMGGRAPTIDVEAPVSPSDRVDLTVTITFHDERELAVPALASLRDMIEAARKDGIVVETRAMLDNADEAMRRLVRAHGAFLDDIRDVSFGDVARVRNAGVVLARGRFLAFLDGDDLWGADWLVRAFRAAETSDAPTRTIWHPEAFLAFWASDCDRTARRSIPDEGASTAMFIQQCGSSPEFEPRDLLFENMWTVNCLAARELHLRFPYRPNDWSRQLGIEDWRFNLETLGHGIHHLVVPETVHLIRMKESGSFGQTHEAMALLPLLD